MPMDEVRRNTINILGTRRWLALAVVVCGCCAQLAKVQLTKTKNYSLESHADSKVGFRVLFWIENRSTCVSFHLLSILRMLHYIVGCIYHQSTIFILISFNFSNLKVRLITGNEKKLFFSEHNVLPSL